MKILAIGDPHGNVEVLKKIDYSGVDLILLPGDTGDARLIRKMTYANIDRRKEGLPEIEYGEDEEMGAFMQIYETSMEVVKFLASKAPVYMVFGNVELSNVKTEEEARKTEKKIPVLIDDLDAMENVHVINHEVVEVGGVRIGGLKYFIDSSWVDRFMSEDDLDYDVRKKGAVEDTKGAKVALDSFGEVDILISHQPPFGVLDVVSNPRAPKHWQGMHAGSKLVLRYTEEEKPRYVLCGHIHEGEGEDKVGDSVVYNLGCCGWRFIEID